MLHCLLVDGSRKRWIKGFLRVQIPGNRKRILLNKATQYNWVALLAISFDFKCSGIILFAIAEWIVIIFDISGNIDREPVEGARLGNFD